MKLLSHYRNFRQCQQLRFVLPLFFLLGFTHLTNRVNADVILLSEYQQTTPYYINAPSRSFLHDPAVGNEGTVSASYIENRARFIEVGGSRTEWVLWADSSESLELSQSFSIHNPSTTRAGSELFFRVTETTEYFFGGAFEGDNTTYFAGLHSINPQLPASIQSKAGSDELSFSERGTLNPGVYQLTQEANISYPHPANFDGSLTFTVGPVGSSEFLPILPTSSIPTITPEDEIQWMFEDIPTGMWCDPEPTSAFDFAMTAGSLFTDILELPTGFTDTFSVTVGEDTVSGLGSGESFNFFANFGKDVSAFQISGINPEVDALDPNGFPIKLAFNTETASFTMTTASASANVEATPEPTSLAIFGIGALCMGAGAARRRRKEKLNDKEN